MRVILKFFIEMIIKIYFLQCCRFNFSSKIHEKMRYVDILYGISTLSGIKVVDAYNTLPVTEGILRKN